MKPICISRTGLLAMFIALAFAVVVPVQASVFIYDAGKTNLPAAQGWILDPSSSQVGTQTNINKVLVVTDTTSASPAFMYGITNNFGVALSTTTEWQMRAVLRIESNYVAAAGQAIYSQFVSDGSQGDGFGIRFASGGGGTNQIGFANDGFPAIRTINVPFDLTSFYQIVVTKTNPNSVILQVFPEDSTNALGSVATTYTGVPGFGTIFPKGVYFGNVNGQPTGTFDVKWATFGLGEAAPIIPEPSVALLGVTAFVLVWCKRLRP